METDETTSIGDGEVEVVATETSSREKKGNKSTMDYKIDSLTHDPAPKGQASKHYKLNGEAQLG